MLRKHICTLAGRSGVEEMRDTEGVWELYGLRLG